MNRSSERFSHRDGIASRLVDGEAVVVSCDEGMVRILNGVGARIWELLDGNRSLADISACIQDEFDITIEAARDDVETFVDELQEKGIVVPVDESAR